MSYSLAKQTAERSDVRVVRAFRPASKLFIFVISSGLQPARDLLFRPFPHPVEPVQPMKLRPLGSGELHADRRPDRQLSETKSLTPQVPQKTTQKARS